jgi:hypothetical protein
MRLVMGRRSLDLLAVTMLLVYGKMDISARIMMIIKGAGAGFGAVMERSLAVRLAMMGMRTMAMVVVVIAR